MLIIGSGISGMASAVRCAERGLRVTMASPFPSERSQSVMAAGGINAVLPEIDSGDTVASYVEDTLKGGCGLGGERAVTGLCEHGEEILRWLEGIGTVFSVDGQGRPLRRAFGGQSHKRTYYCGASTGKQIVSALVMEAAKCLKCGLCLELCPNYVNGHTFFGAAFANDCYLVASRNRAEGGRIRALYAEHFGKTCSKSLSCVEVCPMKIPTLASMAKLNRMKR